LRTKERTEVILGFCFGCDEVTEANPSRFDNPRQLVATADYNVLFPPCAPEIKPRLVLGFVSGAILRRSPNRFPRKSLSSAPTPAGARARSPHQKNPLPIFLFPPPNFFFETEKGVFWW
jgi:hypothetical protein